MRSETDALWPVRCADGIAYDWYATKEEALEQKVEANAECPCGGSHEVGEPKERDPKKPAGVPGPRICSNCGGKPEGGPPGHNVRTCRLVDPARV